MQAQAPQDSFIVSVVHEPQARERTVADVIVGALAIVVVLAASAVLLGGVFAALRLGWLRRHPPDADHMPPVRPGPSASTSLEPPVR